MKNDWQQQFRWSRCIFFPETFKTSRKIFIISQMRTDWEPTLTVANIPGRRVFFENSIPVQFYPGIQVLPGYYLDAFDLDEVKRFVELNLTPLLDYWYEAIDTSDLCDELRDLDGKCISKRH